MRKRNFRQWLLKNRFADGADSRFKLFDIDMVRYPTGINVQFRNFAVIAVKKGDEVGGQITFIFAVQGADNAEVNGEITGTHTGVWIDKNIAGMHVRMKEAVTENLSKEHFHT